MNVIFREAVRDDTLRLDAFLKKRWATSMFLRGNLQDFGLANAEHQYAMRYYLRERGGAIQAVIGISNGGMVMMQAQEGLQELAEYVRENRPISTDIIGFLGESTQVQLVRKTFGFEKTVAHFDDDEPLFTLDLANLKTPRATGAVLRKPKDADIKMLEAWNYAYMTETGIREPGEDTLKMSIEDVTRRAKSGKMRILTINGEPVAQTAFNAMLPESVQIGGVFTPPENRRKGYGRLAVALHLEEAAKMGVKRAVLFSANTFASRAYRGIGFQEVGRFTLTLFT